MRLIVFLLLAAASLAAQRPRYGGRLLVETRSPAPPPLNCDYLVRLDSKANSIPSLAVSWTHDPAFKRWQFRLRAGVTMHDGSILTPQSAASALTAYKAVAAAEGIVIQTQQPAPRLLAELAEACIPDTGPFRTAEPATFVAHEAHWAGRPYLDAVDFQLGRSWKEQVSDFDLGKADVVELPPAESRRQIQRGRQVWISAPLDLIALVFQRGRPSVQDERVRRGLAAAIDRAPMLNVLLQKQGEASGTVLAGWLSGFGFLASVDRDLPRARQILSPLPPAITLGHDATDPALRAISDRLALNAREAGVLMRVVAGSTADVVLVRARASSSDPFLALEQYARSLGAAPPAVDQTWESLYQGEQKLLEDSWVVPLFHVPVIEGLISRVRNWVANGEITRRLEDVWLEAAP